MTMTDIARIRAFNRAYIAQLGIFARDYVGLGYSVTEFRILKEFADNPDAVARDVAKALDVDEAQLSRTLKRFIDKGWMTRTPAKQDARRKRVELTPEGRRKFELANERVDEKTRARLGPVDISSLADKTDEILRMLGHLPPQPLEINDLGPGDAGWIAQRHAEFYHATMGLDATFEALILEILQTHVATCDPARARGFVARQGGRRLGCIFCMGSEDPELAKLRLFFVEPDTQGQGVGKRLMEECLKFARRAGYRRMTLMTHASQDAARALYARYGFTCKSAEAMQIFGRDAIEEHWELTL